MTYVHLQHKTVLNPVAIELYRRPHHALNSSILSCLYTEFIDIIISWDRLVWIFHYSAALGGDAPVCNCITCYYGPFLSLWYYIMLSSNWRCFLMCTFRHWHCKTFHYCYKIIKVLIIYPVNIHLYRVYAGSHLKLVKHCCSVTCDPPPERWRQQQWWPIWWLAERNRQWRCLRRNETKV